MGGFLKGFDESISEGVEGLYAALFMSIVGVMISVFSTLPSGDFVTNYLILFLVIMGMTDVTMILAVAQEALEASIGYIAGRVVGLLLMIYLGRMIGVSMTPYLISLLVLLLVVVVKIVWTLQEIRR
ncbi:hypothetical protein [Thermococcus sibiricus]|uniref:Uncharacterized protein n=2 Tax=Thermococcus sibiricus TaxID=172049 RepID=C6A396_THESM|nr:hypothetical protein [Thermococcus sibiricus]ACS90091.1 hypothetical protein TSIB_1035 [Thermococcus sibiricus MM 739]KUK18646.1 MAG: Uncharacterized protein XD54_0031 [Thermococcus sibiricus]KUK27895.1 MAG: Uncharacterized protein XD61_1563 [Thermococcus sp. 40_45]